MFDYVVIGGGSAGSVLAARLSEDASTRVCLLEAGPEDTSALIQCPAGIALMARTGSVNWAFETVPQAGLGGRRGYQPRGKALGGSSSINAMIYLRGQREDYDGWAAEGNPGWAFDDLLPYFRRAEHNERGADALHGTGGPLNVMDLAFPTRHGPSFVQAAIQAGQRHNLDFNGPSQEGVGPYQVTQRAGERCSAAKAYLTPHRRRPNLQVITGAHTTRILFDGRRAVGVEYLKDGRPQQVQAAREVLLCAGALQSPQLLMLSGIGPAEHLREHGITPLHHLPGVGQALHDHPDVILAYDTPTIRDLFGFSFTGVWQLLRGAIDWQRHRRGILTTNFAEAGGFIRSRPDVTRPDLQLHFVIGKLVDHGRKTVFGHGFSCHVCLLRPRSRGSVRLASADPLAAPLIDPNFFGHPQDLADMVRGLRLTRQIMTQPALAALNGRETRRSASARSDAEIEQFLRQCADTVYHPVGSCRMGRGELDVVDAELRVHGLQGLRVVDASVMPSIVSGNTNAPVIAMAEKAVDLIKAAARMPESGRVAAPVA